MRFSFPEQFAVDYEASYDSSYAGEDEFEAMDEKPLLPKFEKNGKYPSLTSTSQVKFEPMGVDFSNIKKVCEYSFYLYFLEFKIFFSKEF